MGFKLYGIEQSICTQRTLTVLEEKGVSLAEYEIYRPDMMKGEHKVRTPPSYCGILLPTGIHTDCSFVAKTLH